MATIPSSICIDINGTKHRLQLASKLSLSNSVSELRQILSARYQTSADSYFLDAESCRLHIEDEEHVSIGELLTNDNIIQLKTNENESNVTSTTNNNHCYENLNSVQIEERPKISRKEMRTALQESSSHMVEDIFTDLSRDTHIIVCGAPRVGKSTLINALCGREVTKTREGLSPVTQDISRYTMEGYLNTGSDLVRYKYSFWDTPGFESWDKNNIQLKVKEIIEKPETKPLCMIFCASPGTYVDLERLQSLLDLCIIERRIFVVLVCTNKYAGQVRSRRAVLNDLNKLLSKYDKHPPRTENDITFHGTIGLCAAVNSKPYEDEDRTLPVSGINELIYGITTSLVDEQVLKWCLVILDNNGFWKDCQQKFGYLTDSVEEKLKAIKWLFDGTNKKKVQTDQLTSSATWYDT